MNLKYAVSLFLVLGLFGAHSHADWVNVPQDPSVTPAGGGGEVPSPFSTLNQLVELASGEIYSLVGTVVSGPGLTKVSQVIPYLQIDFKEQPWLGTATRRADPNYPLDGGWELWGAYIGKRVKVTVVARGVILWRSSDNLARYVISLKSAESAPIQLLRPVQPPK